MTKTDNANKGVVYLIGAGPGDPDLITVKGKQILQKCQAVVYDKLIASELVLALPESIEKYYVGKRCGKHYLPQEEINKLLVKLANEGKTVARLKGGDPFVFGRGAEEAKYLQEHGVRFEIVSGITSGIAVPAYSGIPCTDRNRSSFVVFATGHKAIEKKLSTVPWEWIAKAKHGTIVIYMGVGELARIVKKLIDNGMPENTPSAIIERGTLPSHRAIRASLSQLPDQANSHNIKPPAIIVIGKVVEFQQCLQQPENKPLFGIRVMVTRAADHADKLYNSLRELGAEVLPYPTIASTDYDDSEGWNHFNKIKNEDRWLIFTSANGVRFFIRQFIDRHHDIRLLSGFKIAAVGRVTLKALRALNLPVDFIPSTASVEAIAAQMRDKLNLARSTIVRIRGNLADSTLEQTLADTGADVLPLNVYRIYYPRWPDGFKDRLFDYPPDAIIFTSGSTVEGLYANLTEDEVKKIAAGKIIASIGPTTSKALQSRKLVVSLEASQHTTSSLIKDLIKFYQRNSRK